MSKMNNVEHYSKLTGEELSREQVTSIQKEDYVNNIRRISSLLEDGRDVNLEDLTIYMGVKKIGRTKIGQFNSYRMVNDNFDIDLFNRNISKNAYYYFNKLVASNCSLTYTLKFKNNTNIKKDLQVADILDISVSSWRKIKKELTGLNLIKIGLVDGEKCYVINPSYVMKNNSILKTEVYKLFKYDILLNIYFVLHSIVDSDMFLYMRDDLKASLSGEGFSELNFKFSKDTYKVNDGVSTSAGIYILYNEGVMIYIGKSHTSISDRVSYHKASKEFDKVKSIEFKHKGDINLYEPYLIQKYKPVYNKDLLEKTNFMLPTIKGI